MNRKGAAMSAAFVSAGLLAGCAGLNPTEQRALTGTGIGAGGGAVLGAIGGNAGLGALAGAGAGLLGGLIFGRATPTASAVWCCWSIRVRVSMPSVSSPARSGRRFRPVFPRRC